MLDVDIFEVDSDERSIGELGEVWWRYTRDASLFWLLARLEPLLPIHGLQKQVHLPLAHPFEPRSLYLLPGTENHWSLSIPLVSINARVTFPDLYAIRKFYNSSHAGSKPNGRFHAPKLGGLQDMILCSVLYREDGA